jgi:hypothetical protein
MDLERDNPMEEPIGPDQEPQEHQDLLRTFSYLGLDEGENNSSNVDSQEEKSQILRGGTRRGPPPNLHLGLSSSPGLRRGNIPPPLSATLPRSPHRLGLSLEPPATAVPHLRARSTSMVGGGNLFSPQFPPQGLHSPYAPNDWEGNYNDLGPNSPLPYSAANQMNTNPHGASYGSNIWPQGQQGLDSQVSSHNIALMVGIFSRFFNLSHDCF